MDFSSLQNYEELVQLRNQMPMRQRKRLEERFYLAWETSVFIYNRLRRDHPDWPEYEVDDERLATLGLVGYRLGSKFGSFLAETYEYAEEPDDAAKREAVHLSKLLGILVNSGPHKKIAKILSL